MKLSIVTAVLNSHEVVRRQVLHYDKIGLSDDTELIIVDDGSDPPLFDSVEKWFDDSESTFDFSMFATNNFRPWTQPAARNFGVKQEDGEYVLVTDIDHIVPKETIDIVRSNTEYDVIRFRRQVGVLDENGDFTQDMKVMREYGLLPERKLKLPPHSNSFAIRKGLYIGLGGVSEQHVGTGKYPNREELPLKRQLKKLLEQDKITMWDDKYRPRIYMFPNGQYCGDKNYNPFGLFHNESRSIRLSRKRQKVWQNSQS